MSPGQFDGILLFDLFAEKKGTCSVSLIQVDGTVIPDAGCKTIANRIEDLGLRPGSRAR